MVAKKATKLDFAASLKELESIVTVIEQGGISLEESLRFFEQGVKLTKKCQQMMREAEQKVKILTRTGLADFKEEDSGRNTIETASVDASE